MSKKNQEHGSSLSHVSGRDSSAKTNREHHTSSSSTSHAANTLDPVLITTIHANKGAIEITRGQISELRRDVDHMRTQIQPRKRTTMISPNPATIIPEQNHQINTIHNSNSPSLSNPEDTNLVQKSNVNPSDSSVSHHHHHHHHLSSSGTVDRSAVCTIF